ncbi:uncharacterized protein LOC123543357 [Mercenaria mercenaria]|uniref:uncharacterized protein LOC123543357 n=1 Tax=Mercenaria mercenaria TaxID=6596 RepID=UPI00234E3801|nr:uncharacterized protein LOC123543357 [Mercenaria mercenaria]
MGVKQGDPASSILCLFFLNDIVNNVNTNIDGILNIDDLQLFLLLFADGAVVFAHDPNSLQSMLNDIEEYSNLWGLRLNVNKTKVMIFEKGRHTHFGFYLYNNRIELVDAFKYLGVYLYKNGNWNRTQKRIAQHGSYSLHNLFVVCNQLDLPISQKSKLFDSLVASTLNYAAEIWGNHLGPYVELIHTKFCRKVLGVKRSTNLSALYGELGRVPMSINRKLIMIKYWVKLLTSKENSILFKTYKMLKTDVDQNNTYSKCNWAFQIKHLLDECGLSYIWQNQFNMLINYNSINQRILDMFYQSWYGSINNSRRLETYNTLEYNFEFEKYLDFIKGKRFRMALTRFRTSSHDLAIEKGRYTSMPRNERICKNCNFGQIENEYHF